MKKEEIDTKYLIQHKRLGKWKDAVNKKLFDQLHRKLWADHEAELTAKGYGK